MLYQEVVTSRPDLPLVAVATAGVLVRQRKVKLRTFTTPALGRAYALIICNELRVVSNSLWRQSAHNAIVNLHLELAIGTLQSLDLCFAARTKQLGLGMR